MIAIIDCGTTFTRIYIVDSNGNIIAESRKKVGVRDTVITGTKDALKKGICDLFDEIMQANCINKTQVKYMVTFGMITSEIGLHELKHLIAPISINEIAESMLCVADDSFLPVGIPIYLIRGIRNNYVKVSDFEAISNIDFMRGEEVQCIGIAKLRKLTDSTNIVVLSSHTKIIHLNKKGDICGSITTLSGQIYEAILNSTSIGKSIAECSGEMAAEFTDDQIISAAQNIVTSAGLLRALLMPRFMEMLLNTDYKQRRLFIDAALTTDDMKAFDRLEKQGFWCNNFIFFGQRNRCDLYAKLLSDSHNGIRISTVSDNNELAIATITGIIEILKKANIPIS